jgi:hypothetical protein
MSRKRSTNTGKRDDIPFVVLSATSEDKDRPFKELERLNPNTPGWQTARNCDYPQSIILKLKRASSVRSISVLSHQAKIATKVRIFYSASDDSDEAEATANVDNDGHDNEDNKASQLSFQKMGSFLFESNEAEKWKSRQLVNVNVDAELEIQYLKFDLLGCWDNPYNPHGQVGFIGIRIQGKCWKTQNTDKNHPAPTSTLSLPLAPTMALSPSLAPAAAKRISRDDPTPADVSRPKRASQPQQQPTLRSSNGSIPKSVAARSHHRPSTLPSARRDTSTGVDFAMKLKAMADQTQWDAQRGEFQKAAPAFEILSVMYAKLAEWAKMEAHMKDAILREDFDEAKRLKEGRDTNIREDLIRDMEALRDMSKGHHPGQQQHHHQRPSTASSTLNMDDCSMLTEDESFALLPAHHRPVLPRNPRQQRQWRNSTINPRLPDERLVDESLAYSQSAVDDNTTVNDKEVDVSQQISEHPLEDDQYEKDGGLGLANEGRANDLHAEESTGMLNLEEIDEYEDEDEEHSEDAHAKSTAKEEHDTGSDHRVSTASLSEVESNSQHSTSAMPIQSTGNGNGAAVNRRTANPKHAGSSSTMYASCGEVEEDEDEDAYMDENYEAETAVPREGPDSNANHANEVKDLLLYKTKGPASQYYGVSRGGNNPDGGAAAEHPLLGVEGHAHLPTPETVYPTSPSTAKAMEEIAADVGTYLMACLMSQNDWKLRDAALKKISNDVHENKLVVNSYSAPTLGRILDMALRDKAVPVFSSSLLLLETCLEQLANHPHVEDRHLVKLNHVASQLLQDAGPLLLDKLGYTKSKVAEAASSALISFAFLPIVGAYSIGKLALSPTSASIGLSELEMGHALRARLHFVFELLQQFGKDAFITKDGNGVGNGNTHTFAARIIQFVASVGAFSHTLDNIMGVQIRSMVKDIVHVLYAEAGEVVFDVLLETNLLTVAQIEDYGAGIRPTTLDRTISNMDAYAY